MVVFPIDKYLAQDYRNTLRTADSPQNIDTDAPLIPVIDVQKGFPKPNSKQRLVASSVQFVNSASQSQIVTTTPNLKYYLVGVLFAQGSTAIASGLQIADATSGAAITPPSTSILIEYYCPAGQTNYQVWLPLPTEVINGIRVINGSGTGTYTYVVYYIEERLN